MKIWLARTKDELEPKRKDRSDSDAGVQISDGKGWDGAGVLRGQRGAETVGPWSTHSVRLSSPRMEFEAVTHLGFPPLVFVVHMIIQNAEESIY